jgi:hypothetical protein
MLAGRRFNPPAIFPSRPPPKLPWGNPNFFARARDATSLVRACKHRNCGRSAVLMRAPRSDLRIITVREVLRPRRMFRCPETAGFLPQCRSTDL